MCSFLALSNKVETASGIGKAVIFVNGITVPLNWCIKTYFLDKKWRKKEFIYQLLSF